MVGHGPLRTVAETFVKTAGAGASTGALAMRNVAEKSGKFSNSLQETTPRVLSLQRDWLRSVPWIKRAYNIRYPESVGTAIPIFDTLPPICSPHAPAAN